MLTDCKSERVEYRAHVARRLEVASSRLCVALFRWPTFALSPLLPLPLPLRACVWLLLLLLLLHL